ncbi:MAG: hypothetical protein AB1430_11045 [Pseudomonadota bacterium]
MLTAPTAASWPELGRGLREPRPPAHAAPVGCGGWHVSSAELREGLMVVEHDHDQAAEMLLEFLSFE